MYNNNLIRKSKFVSGFCVNIWHLKVIIPEVIASSNAKIHFRSTTNLITHQISHSNKFRLLFLPQLQLFCYSTFLAILFSYANTPHNKHEYYLKRFISDFHLESKNWKGNFLFAFWTVSYFWQPVRKQRVPHCSRIFWIDCSNVGE